MPPIRIASIGLRRQPRGDRPPGKPIGGVSGIAKGGLAYVPVDLEPGESGRFCFLPDVKDGKLHIAHGMIMQFAVK